MTRTIATALLVSLSLGWIQPAAAGGPMPRQAMINRLNAVEHNLGVIHTRLVAALAYPPDPCLPLPALTGKLTAMGNQLDAIHARVLSALAFPPDPCTPPDPCVSAVAAVRQSAEDIVKEARCGDVGPPDDLSVKDALARVASSAQATVLACDGFLVR